jgi:hypothetical protein
MSLYRCYFVTSADHISDVQEVMADCDADAIEFARVIVASQPLCTAEVWQSSRLVRKNIWPSAPCRGADGGALAAAQRT